MPLSQTLTLEELAEQSSAVERAKIEAEERRKETSLPAVKQELDVCLKAQMPEIHGTLKKVKDSKEKTKLAESINKLLQEREKAQKINKILEENRISLDKSVATSLRILAVLS